jgi:hypothetical protein
MGMKMPGQMGESDPALPWVRRSAALPVSPKGVWMLAMPA